MNKIKNYDDFLSEGILDNIKDKIAILKDKLSGILEKAGEFFKGKGSSFLNLLVLQNRKELPKGIEIYPAQSDIQLLRKNGIEYKPLSMQKISEGINSNIFSDILFENEQYKTEGKVSLESPGYKVPNVNLEELMKAIEKRVKNTGKTNIPPKPMIIWGAPGIAKTALINAVGKKEFGDDPGRVIIMDLTQMQAEDFQLPYKYTKMNDIESYDVIRTVPIGSLPLIPPGLTEEESGVNGPDGKGGLIFFDEIGRCNPAVQNAILNFVQNRKLAGRDLGSKWTIVCAANRKIDIPEELEGTFNMNATLANRFLHVNFVMQVSDWLSWSNKEDYIKIDDSGNIEHKNKLIDIELVPFLIFNNKYFHYYNKEELEESKSGSMPWTSPRTWTKGFTGIRIREARIGRKLKNSEKREMLKSSVGVKTANAYMDFVDKIESAGRDADKIAEKILNGKNIIIDKNEKNMDEKNIKIASIIIKFPEITERLSKDNMKNIIDWIEKENLKSDAEYIFELIENLYSVPYLAQKTSDKQNLIKDPDWILLKNKILNN